MKKMADESSSSEKEGSGGSGSSLERSSTPEEAKAPQLADQKLLTLKNMNVGPSQAQDDGRSLVSSFFDFRNS